jgi:hypothetical protein
MPSGLAGAAKSSKNPNVYKLRAAPPHNSFDTDEKAVIPWKNLIISGICATQVSRKWTFVSKAR